MRQQPGARSCRGLQVRMAGGALFERGRNARMELLAPAAQQGVISGILDEGMLEDERCLRHDATAQDQPGADELIERVAKLVVRPARYRSQQVVRKFAADRRADLRYLFYWS
jgi:hypothetical protein